MCSSWDTVDQATANMAIGVVVGCTNVLGFERAKASTSSMFSVCIGPAMCQLIERAHGWYQKVAFIVNTP